ncbi:hypothetical protein AAG906_033271 [Vitis piasezkii]
MTMTQFAMVEELAFLIKDNLPCKHLVLSIEEALVNFLQGDNSPDGVMELEPMNPYERLLVHRLADIFGFAHVSIGEGDERHLTLERCPETSIPSILVSDIIWQYQESQPPTMSHQLLRRNEASPVLKAREPSLQYSLEEREAAYLAARERIFSMDEGEIRESVQQKPRNVPVVARRMIAHALGHRINSCNQDVKECEGQIAELTVQDKDSSAEACQNENSCSKTSVGSHNGNGALSHGGRKTPQQSADRSPSNSSSPPSRRNRSRVCTENPKEVHLGAARRMFAHALGLQSPKDALISKPGNTQQMNTE